MNGPVPPAPGDYPLKYAVIERERRFVVKRVPGGVVTTHEITDRYLVDTRLRLREVREPDGSLVRKLGLKVRTGEGTGAVAVTNLYLDEIEWQALVALPSRTLRKRRHVVERDGWKIAVDEYEDGTLIAEVDDGDGPVRPVPAWLGVVREVTADEAWTGAGQARRLGHPSGGADP